ncbi:Transcription factor MYB98 [Hondaea fermentalgiana]|uniref:Transcription factor MYB98 n=1 Tax=Hondaea fermentalgiana TaxID=2315210 RepID=A0A2R5GMC5_9STRA|nr:Transcription factor MYB98 [Hondaea fermentalgiana]|eukprot:GBG30888.1 Transcription factor MYB98 [Hondaea fermentalgiana]
MFLEDGTRKGIVLMRRESAGSERGGATAASLAPWARDQPDNVAHLQSAHAHIHPQHLASAHPYRPRLSRYEVSEHHDHLHHHHHHHGSGGGGGGGGGTQHVYQHHGHEGYEMPQPEPRAGEHSKGGASYMFGDELFDYAEIGGEATGPPPPPPPTASARVLPPPTAASRPGEEASFYYRPPPTPPSPNAAHPLAFSRYEGDLDHHSLQVPRLEQRRYSSQHLQQQQEPPQEQPQDTTPSGNHASLARGHTAAEDNQNEPQRGNQHHPRHSSHHPVRHDDPTSRPDASDTMKREHQARSHGGVMTRRSSLMVSPHARGENGYAQQHSSPHSRTPGTNAGALDPLASTQSEGAGRTSIKRSRAEFDEASEPPGSPQSAKSAPNSYAKKRRRRWLNFEDELLRDSVQSYLDTQAPHHESSKIKIPWNKIAQLIPNRNAKQCRDRWQAMRGPHSKREWSMEDDLCLLQLQKRFSNRWVRIAAAFPDRNDNMVKSRFRVLSKLKITPEHLIAQIDRCNASKQARKAVVDDGRGSMSKPSIQEFDGHAPSHGRLCSVFLFFLFSHEDDDENDDDADDDAATSCGSCPAASISRILDSGTSTAPAPAHRSVGGSGDAHANAYAKKEEHGAVVAARARFGRVVFHVARLTDRRAMLLFFLTI